MTNTKYITFSLVDQRTIDEIADLVKESCYWDSEYIEGDEWCLEQSSRCLERAKELRNQLSEPEAVTYVDRFYF